MKCANVFFLAAFLILFNSIHSNFTCKHNNIYHCTRHWMRARSSSIQRKVRSIYRNMHRKVSTALSFSPFISIHYWSTTASRRAMMCISLITVKTLWQHKVEWKMNSLENVTFFFRFTLSVRQYEGGDEKRNEEVIVRWLKENSKHSFCS